jgi:hypothetical protein
MASEPRAKIHIRSAQEFCAGLLFVLIGLAWAIAAAAYGQGTATRMGPGYFPHAIALALACVGLCSVVRSLRVVDAAPIGRWPWLTIALVLGGVAAFALLLDRFGLIPASLALILLAAGQRLRRRPVELAMLALCITGFVTALFLVALQLPLKLF